MALLGSFIDNRTSASLASNASASFAHGLPAAPDFVIIQAIGSATIASGSGNLPRYSADATNVSIFGTGLATDSFRITSIVAHSVIR